jgi:NTE family protein
MLDMVVNSGASVLSAISRRAYAASPSDRGGPWPRIGLALGGGFARGIAHAGVLEVFERADIPIHCIAGVSAGAIVASAFASGATPAEIASAGRAMKFTDVARWSVNRMGLADSERMNGFLKKLLKQFRFEDMQIPLGVVATDLATGTAALFEGRGDVSIAVRASCSYPGLFQPVRHEGRLLVDGAMSMEIPAGFCRRLGATHVIAVNLPTQGAQAAPGNMLQVVNRCFQIMQAQREHEWRQASDMVLSPEVRTMQWDAFASAGQLLESGRRAAEAALPAISSWLETEPETVASYPPEFCPAA